VADFRQRTAKTPGPPTRRDGYVMVSFIGKIVIITPVRSSSWWGGSGRTHDRRWTLILRELGHDVHVAHRSRSGADLMIALHACAAPTASRIFASITRIGRGIALEPAPTSMTTSTALLPRLCIARMPRSPGRAQELARATAVPARFSAKGSASCTHRCPSASIAPPHDAAASTWP